MNVQDIKKADVLLKQTNGDNPDIDNFVPKDANEFKKVTDTLVDGVKQLDDSITAVQDTVGLADFEDLTAATTHWNAAASKPIDGKQFYITGAPVYYKWDSTVSDRAVVTDREVIKKTNNKNDTDTTKVPDLETVKDIAKDKIVVLGYVGVDDYTGAVEGDLRWDSPNRRLLIKTDVSWGVFLDYTNNTFFVYENTNSKLLIRIVSDSLDIVSRETTPTVTTWENGALDVNTDPRRFYDYYFDDANNALRVRGENAWSYDTIPIGTLVKYNGITYRKDVNLGDLQIVATTKDITTVDAARKTYVDTQISTVNTSIDNTNDNIKTYDSVLTPSSAILYTYPLLANFIKSIKIIGSKTAIEKNWTLKGFSNGNLNDGVNKPYVKLNDGATDVTISLTTRTTTAVYTESVSKAQGSATVNVVLSPNTLTNVAITIVDLTTSVIDLKKCLVYESQYVKHPIAYCKNKSLYDDLLIGIDDAEFYGIPVENDVFIERTYTSSGSLRIELNYTDKVAIDGTKYNFLYIEDVVNIDFITDQSTRIEFENRVSGSTARATMWVNFSKVNSALSYTSSQEGNIIFSKSCNKSTYPLGADLILPSIIPSVYKRPFRICFESAAHDGSKKEILGNGFDIITNKNIGKYYRTTFTATGNTTLKAKLLEGNKVLKYKESTITTVSANSGSGVNKSFVFCGDSKTDKTTKLEWLKALFADDVMDITLLGTQDTGTYPNEGYSGRNVIDLTEDSTLNTIANPFYNNALVGDKKWDLASFINVDGRTPDCVWIDHGANQVSANWSDIKASYDHILANVTAYNTTNETSIAVVFSIQESASLLADIDGNKGALKNSILKLGRKMLTEYDNRQNEGLFICPQYLNVDLEWDFPWAYVPRMNNIGALEPRTSDSVHSGEQSFVNYNSGTPYALGAQVSNGGENFVVIKEGIKGITPTDDKVNYAIIEDGIGAGYRNIAESYFCLIKYMETIV